MGSKKEWRKKAEEYYRDGLMIEDISALLGISRKSISGYLKTIPDHEQIQEKRRKEYEKRRRKYKTVKQQQYRQQMLSIGGVTADTMKREHELAVMELSRERYH